MRATGGGSKVNRGHKDWAIARCGGLAAQRCAASACQLGRRRSWPAAGVGTGRGVVEDAANRRPPKPTPRPKSTPASVQHPLAKVLPPSLESATEGDRKKIMTQLTARTRQAPENADEPLRASWVGAAVDGIWARQVLDCGMPRNATMAPRRRRRQVMSAQGAIQVVTRFVSPFFFFFFVQPPWIELTVTPCRRPPGKS